MYNSDTQYRQKEFALLNDAVATLDETIIQLIHKIHMEAKHTADTIVVDTETTGLTEYDEPLQISIIDADGNTLYNQYLRPIYHDTWEEAERIHHISPQMVQGAPNIYQEMPRINAILAKATTIVGYNHIHFDCRLLRAYGAVFPDCVELFDVMLAFAEICGEWNEVHKSNKWQKLTTCAEYYHYDWDGDTAHDSLADCHATLHCYHQMMKSKEREQP
ncbi:MAG: 3'-5' exonuclease [Oscillospiraceae bacterium]|nr:3'-5' exonuclease [Oscillospiraceae bacterium]